MKTLAYTWIMALVLCALMTGCRDYSPHQSEASTHSTATDRAPEGREPIRTPIQTSVNTASTTTTSSEDAERVDEVQMNAGCTINPARMAVANGHDIPSMCEYVNMTAVAVESGDGYEIGAPFVWALAGDDIVNLDCFNGPHDNVCGVRGHTDIFEVFSADEPAVQLMSCAMNACALDDAGCEPLVCATVTIDLVVNIEGTWNVTSDPIYPDSTLQLVQDGRSFTAQNIAIHDGSVDGPRIYFTSGDYAYSGILLPGKSAILGTVTDLLTMSYSSIWAATRSP